MDAILEEANMMPILTTKLNRELGRANNCEAWL